ncbi:hypothetical protein L798_11362 [Zootermopsis nevadensis]|uniref:DUF4817 domain-containing protein n=1 Tax=Zootermopsis nevadensis TaxID=136037 RepID=A0A067RJ05_ZOONE|nr:hypothetical protein L798_11362 [Zootermopsis nevadensis]
MESPLGFSTDQLVKMADNGRLTLEQRTKLVLLYAETKSVIVTQRRFRKHFGTRWAPAKNTIYRLFQLFENNGTVLEPKHTTFGERILSHRFPQRHQCGRIWPPHSPDINPCYYFLWGFLKEQVFHQHPESLAELRARIMQVCSTIDEYLCRRVVQNMNVRLEELVRQNGGHIEHVLR